MPEFFGLDIGSHSLKVVELELQGSKHRLLAFGSVATPTGAPFSESEIDQKELANSIKALLKDAKVKSRSVVSAFPESLIFTRVIELPAMSEKELASAMSWEAEQYVPMPLSEVKMSWMVLGEESGKGKEKGVKNKEAKIQVLLVAAPLTLIERYSETMHMAGILPVAFETEIIALSRSFIPQTGEGPTTMIVSIGASTTDLSIIERGVIRFTRSIGTGGTALARVISQELGFEMGQAEEYKKSYGLLHDQLEGKIMQTIKPVFDVIVNEIDRARLYFQTHNPTSPVRRIVLAGGTSQLPGVVVYLAESLGVEVQLGNPWESIEVPEGFFAQTAEIENQVKYAVAVGLAMRKV